jgi:glutamate-ammonia-ligase adenylyltransferase
VHGHFNQVFAIEDKAGGDTDSGLPWAALWRGELDEGFACELLENQGIDDGEELLRQLKLFRESVHVRSLSGVSAQRLQTLMPLLLKQLVARKHATSLLTRVLNLLQAVVRRSVYLALLIEYPVALDQVIRLCAASPWIASLLTRYPILLDELLDARALYEIPNKPQLVDELDGLLAHSMDDEEAQMEILRKFKQAHVLRIAAMDVAHALKVFDVSEQLTLIGEVLLAKTYELALSHMTKRHGRPGCLVDGQQIEPGMAVIAYGKLGGRELGYGSDLDLVFLHDSRGEQQHTDGEKSLDNSTFFARVAQRIVHILGTQTANGRLYEVDTRLRPDGAAGMLVSSLDAFVHYQQEKAWTWEHQALIRARMVVGSAHIGEEFDRIRFSVLSRHRDMPSLQADVLEMRQKMRDALGSKKAEEFHLKQDAGGLVDIEFIAQFCVLAWASTHPQLLQQTATRRLLQALVEMKCLDQAVVTKLSGIYEQYRVRSHQRALQEQSSALDDSEFTSQRADVINIWQQLLVEKPVDSLGE